MSYGLLVDYKWCSGCHSCEVACKNEKGFSVEQPLYGVKLLQVGPHQIDEDGNYEWNYFPVLTQFCDLCTDRFEKTGEVPPCVIVCLGQCLEYGPVEELAKKLDEKGKMGYIMLP